MICIDNGQAIYSCTFLRWEYLVQNYFDRSDMLSEEGINNSFESNRIIELHIQVLVFVILLFWNKL